MSEENIFKPSATRRAVTASGLPLSHYFSTSREMKRFIEDSDQFIDECLLEKAARDGGQALPDDKLEEQSSEPQRLPSRSNHRSHRRRKPRHN